MTHERVSRAGLTALAWIAWAASEAAAVIPVQRPDGNTGQGFFVRDGEVYDAHGLPFRIRGVNHTHAFGNQTQNVLAIPEIDKSNANAVRMVLYRSGTGITLTAAQQRDLITQYVARDVVPIVELHDYTGGNEATNGQSIVQAVDYWLEPSRKAYLQEFEREVILNIANEWGPNSTVWRDAYITGVQRLRDAGVNNLIMIDAGGNFGQNPRSIKSWGQQIMNADPQHNVVFSQHMYGYWFTSPSVPNWAYSVRNELTAIKNLGLPLVIGEFGWEEHSEVNYDTSDAMQIFEELGIGWMAWAWYRGQNPGDALSLIKLVNGDHSILYNSDSDLTPFGNLVINNPTYGTKAAARRASIFAAVPGDFDGDDDVDADDLQVWQGNYGNSGFDGAAFLNWQRGLGANPATASSSTAVAEPAAMALAVVGLLAAVTATRLRSAF